MRSLLLALLLALLAGIAVAQDWGRMATVSATMGVSGSRLCVGEASRGDIGCPAYAPSLTTAGDLTVSGSVTAAQFIGDGSGLTGVVAGSSDRIVSGTGNATSMVAISGTGIISVTQNGTNTAYFHPSLGLVTIGVSSTGPISATRVYAGNFGTSGSLIYRDANGNLTASSTFIISSTTGSLGIGADSPASSGINSLYASGGVRAGTDLTAGNNVNLSQNIYWGNGNFASIMVGGNNDHMAFRVSNSEAMRIVSSGYVGIGTTAPSYTLDVNGTARVIGDGNASTPDLIVTNNSNTGIAGGIGGANGQLRFYDLTPNMRASIDSSGLYVYGLMKVFSSSTGTGQFVQLSSPTSWMMSNVGIGTITPTTALEVSGTVSATHFVGDGSGLTGIASSGDRIVSGSAYVKATQNVGGEVSGTFKVSSTGNEPCDATHAYSLRVNQATGFLQMCRP